MSLVCVTPPGTEPVAAEEQRDHSRIDINDDDSVLNGFIAAAREWCEAKIRRQFVSATWRLKLDTFAGDLGEGCDFCSVPYSLAEIELPNPPLQSVTSITYYDASNTLQTLSTSVYEVDADSTPGVIRLKPLQVWPTTYYRRKAVSITYVAGYGGSAATDAVSVAAVPESIKTAIKMKTGLLYENREGTDDEMRAINSLLGCQAWGSYP